MVEQAGCHRPAHLCEVMELEAWFGPEDNTAPEGSGGRRVNIPSPSSAWTTQPRWERLRQTRAFGKNGQLGSIKSPVVWAKQTLVRVVEIPYRRERLFALLPREIHFLYGLMVCVGTSSIKHKFNVPEYTATRTIAWIWIVLPRL